MTRPTFALIGAAGYIAPKHGAAIKAVGGELVAACDAHDAVGWLDRDWPRCEFFIAHGGWHVKVGNFATAISTIRVLAFKGADFHVVASPNDAHVEQVKVLLPHSDVICEKPLTLGTRDLRDLAKVEEATGHRVFTIQNLRHHPEMIAAKRHAEEHRPETVDVRYIAPRGPWYDVSWKGDPARSGGLIFNIGIHVLDALLWMLGPVHESRVVDAGKRWVSLETVHRHAMLRTAVAHVTLSTDPTAAPERRFEIAGEGVRGVYDLAAPFSLGEGGLHAECYREILAGRGPGIEEARPSIALAEKLTGEMS